MDTTLALTMTVSGNTWGAGWLNLENKKKKQLPAFAITANRWRVSSKARFNISIFPTFPDAHTQPPTHHSHPPATEMWVNEAPPGDTGSNTFITSLIQGRGGERVSGDLRDMQPGQHQRYKCGRMQLIRLNDCMYELYVWTTSLRGDESSCTVGMV